MNVLRMLNRQPLRAPCLRFPSRCHASMVGPPLRKKVTSVDLRKLKAKGKPISMVTAYTYPSAMHVDAAGIDVLLVGDSLAMVELGHPTTLPVTVDDMLYHCKAVARGASSPLLVGDMPFGSYEGSVETAYNNAVRFLKEGGMDAVKMEGNRTAQVRHLVAGGVAVMGHIGLTPQQISVLGGFRAQGKTTAAALDLIEQAKGLEAAGCFALIIECVPAEVAHAITAAIEIPTIGIGAGPHTNGQVLVFHDLLGMLQHAHHAKVAPSFCKTYADVGAVIQKGLDQYRLEVETGVFPGEDFSPYKMNKKEKEAFAREMGKKTDALSTAATPAAAGAAAAADAAAAPTDEDPTITVY